MTPVQQEQQALRGLTSQLSEDLSWLEEHCRGSHGPGAHASQLRYAAALARNVLGPFLDGQPPEPLHIAVLGGAGAGKSSVANLLMGATVAEANPQAGFTRHPVGYVASGAAITWPAHLGFLGPLKRLSEPSPSSLDADVYQVRRVPVQPEQLGLLDQFVVWDCPDVTTWAATGYVPRLLEIAALADVLVYVASDERYNDEVPTEYLKMLLESGKAVTVCLVKMREADAPAFIDHFRKEVLQRFQGEAIEVFAIPFLTPEERADPLTHARRWQIPLLNQIQVLATPPDEARRRTVRTALNYLLQRQEQLLGVTKHDLSALQGWRGLVVDGRLEFDNRYRREFLTSERFHRFDEALVRLLELLELPGIGRVLSGALYVVRTPYRVLKTLFTKALQRPNTPSVPEQPVLEQAMRGWLDMLRKEAGRRAEHHAVWRHIDKGFSTGMADAAMTRFEEAFRAFQASQADEVERTARAIYEALEKNPVALNTLRGTKFALEVGAITGTVLAGGVNWFDLVLVPLAASVTHQLVELLGKQYVDIQREEARSRQQALVAQHISGPLCEWLTQWPTTGGSTYERLQIALRRVPATLQQLHRVVSDKLAARP